jgi:hypothetical protein
VLGQSTGCSMHSHVSRSVKAVITLTQSANEACKQCSLSDLYARRDTSFPQGMLGNVLASIDINSSLTGHLHNSLHRCRYLHRIITPYSSLLPSTSMRCALCRAFLARLLPVHSKGVLSAASEQQHAQEPGQLYLSQVIPSSVISSYDLPTCTVPNSRAAL